MWVNKAAKWKELYFISNGGLNENLGEYSLNIHALSFSPHQALIVILMCSPNTPHITMLVECVELTGDMAEPLWHLFKGRARYGSYPPQCLTDVSVP